MDYLQTPAVSRSSRCAAEHAVHLGNAATQYKIRVFLGEVQGLLVEIDSIYQELVQADRL